MSESRKYLPTASIKRSKFETRLVTAKGKTYQVTQYIITKENFLKLCRELKEYGFDRVKYVNLDVWEPICDVTAPDQPADQSADLPF